MITGSIVAIVTPMKDNLEIDWDAFSRLIEFQIENNTNAIAVLGTTGESATITPKTHIECIKFVVDKVNKRVPVIAGTGANNTVEAVYLAKAAKEVGADLHLSVVPYYNKPNQAGIYAHYMEIANNCELPMLLYNVPGRTVADASVETVVKLSKHKNIIGIKEASTIERCRELLKAVPKDFLVISGEDPINCQIISEGVAGAISVTANVAPKLMSEVCRLAKTDLEKAKLLDEKLSLLHTDLFVEPSPSPTKWALKKMGLIDDNIRLPLVKLSKEGQKVVEKAMRKAEIL